MRPSRWLSPSLTLLAVGCVGGSSVEAPPLAPEPVDRIPAAEVRSGPQTNCSELLRVLRPRWSGLVYVDGVRVGSMDVLERIPVEDIESLELGRAVDPRGRRIGVILVTSRRR